MSRKKQTSLHTGSVIHDTPRIPQEADRVIPFYAGYNGGFAEHYPTVGIGSYCEFTAYFERYLWRDTIKILDFKIPLDWDQDYFLWILYRQGYVALVNTKEFGLIPQYGTLSGRNVYYQPTKVCVANPCIKQKGWKLGEDAALIKLTSDYQGIWDLIHHYAEEAAAECQSLRMAIVNTRLQKGYATDTKAVSDTIHTMLEQLDQGKPAVVTMMGNLPKDKNSNLPWVEIENHPGADYLVDKLQAALENCLDRYHRDIGVPVASDKKERLVAEEADTQTGEALTAIDTWYDCLTRSIEVAKQTFPELELSVSKPSRGQEKPQEDREEDEEDA